MPGALHRCYRAMNDNDHWSRTLFLVCLSAVLTRCWSTMTCSQYLRPPTPGYHLIKECAASKMRTVASSNATGLNSCVQLATAKGGFAFTYSNVTGGYVRDTARRSIVLTLFPNVAFRCRLEKHCRLYLQCLRVPGVPSVSVDQQRIGVRLLQHVFKTTT